ncbi:MAG: TIGR01212 family radical SAM protein [Candidatus Omnitrophica bacterium]|nr:TIGR01212 family radical SAM protein [Candidatus Omnitrophota bacterium]
MKEKYFSFNAYLREKFGERVHRISIDAGFSCPNIDGILGKQGCIYCNNKGFGVYAKSGKTIEEQIEESIIFYRRRLGVKKFIAYFQSYTNTYAEPQELKEKYDLIRKFPQIIGLFISTRPDCIDEEKIRLISQYKKDYLVWIEYGLQTTHNRLLKIINRNHTYEDFIRALDLTRKYGVNVGVHLILGLPSSTDEEIIEDAQRLSMLDIQGIKFHILHVLKGTRLEEMYEQGGVNLLTREKYVKMVSSILSRIPPFFVVLRLVSSALPDYLVAPLWINRRSEVVEDIRKELEKRGTRQGCLFEKFKNQRAKCKRAKISSL